MEYQSCLKIKRSSNRNRQIICDIQDVSLDIACEILNAKPKKLSGVEGIQKYLKRIRKPDSFVSRAFEF